MEIIINGNTVNGTASELAKLLAVMDTATEAANATPKPKAPFWSSDILTGSQTRIVLTTTLTRFGAVTY